MMRIGNVLRGLALAVLTLGALASLGFALISIYDYHRNQGWVTSDTSIIESLNLERTIWRGAGSGRNFEVRAEHDALLLTYRGPERRPEPFAPVGMIYSQTWVTILPGLKWSHGPSAYHPQTHWYEVSYWYFVALLGGWPLVALVRHWRRRARGKPRGCPACGYDLTGNVNGVCPECGQLAAAYHEPT